MDQPHPIEVGTLAVARRDTAVCRAGEVGVCYDVYELAGRPGYGFLFQRGGYDGFSPGDVAAFLDVQPVRDARTSGYAFVDVERLRRDYERGLFRSALGSGPGGGGAALLVPSAPDSLPPVAVHVLDRLPDPPETFDAADVLDALRAWGGGVEHGAGPSVTDVLDALLAHELVSSAGQTGGRRTYVVHPEARPF